MIIVMGTWNNIKRLVTLAVLLSLLGGVWPGAAMEISPEQHGNSRPSFEDFESTPENSDARGARSVNRAPNSYAAYVPTATNNLLSSSGKRRSSSMDDCGKCTDMSQSCPDTTGDLLQLFSSGVSLSFMFAMIAQGMLTNANPIPAMPNPAPQGRRGLLRDSWDDVQAGSTDPGGSFLFSLPTLLTTEVGPLAVDYLSVYIRRQKNPECVRRWMCEATQRSMKNGGLRAKLASMSSVAVSWFFDNTMPFLENMDKMDEFDCSILVPDCKQPLHDDT